MAALAGFILAARFGSTRPDIGTGLELTVITVTVLGGVSIFGGSGTMVGAVLALVLVGILRFGMGLINLQGQVQDIVIGLLLILSILLPQLGSRIVGWARRGSRATAPKAAMAVTIVLLFGRFLLLVARAYPGPIAISRLFTHRRCTAKENAYRRKRLALALRCANLNAAISKVANVWPIEGAFSCVANKSR